MATKSKKTTGKKTVTKRTVAYSKDRTTSKSGRIVDRYISGKGPLRALPSLGKTSSSVVQRNTRSKRGASVTNMPLLLIRNKKEHAAALDAIDELMQQSKLAPTQRRYAETLAVLIEDYERRNHSIDRSHLTGLDMLKYLLEENDMSGADLARLLEVHRSLASKILNGERALTVGHMRKLGERFRVDPGVFI